METIVLQIVTYCYDWIFLILLAGISIWLMGVNLYKKHWLNSIILLIIPSFTIIYGPSMYNWLSSLGADSFTETQDFNWEEAKFFLETAALILTAEENRKIIVLILFSLATAVGIEITRQLLNLKLSKFILAGTASLIIFPIILTFKFSLLFESNSNTYKKLLDNFNNEFEISSQSNSDLQVIVYIGESISAMHFGLYNYFRDTTPKLSQIAATDSGLIKLNQAYSPHTHTAESLLENLSIGVDEFSKNIPIKKQKRISIINILNAAHIETRWISNQAQSGPGAFTATIIANDANKKFFSFGNKYASNIDSIKGTAAVFDGDLLVSATDDALNTSNPKVVFLHSYAGHGPYLKSIPTNQQNKVDNKLDSYSNQALFGNIAAHKLRIKLENYDTAIKYVDTNVSKVIYKAKQSKKPVVVIFFSDHGESLFSGRGHDSSRYIYEMSRIPFILYFNKPARKNRSKIFKELQQSAKTNNPIIGAQLPAFILDLFKIQTASLQIAPKLGQSWGKQPIYTSVRQTINEISYLQLNPQVTSGDTNQLIDALKLQSTTSDTTQICYHRSNSVGKIMRGLLALPCIEVDALVENDKIFITHPSAPKTNLDFELVLNIANKNKATVWFDGKNLNEPKNCEILLTKLISTPHKQAKIFVEFPESTNLQNSELLSCAKNLNALPNTETSFYIPAELAESCKSASTKIQCNKLNNFLKTVINTKAFSNFSFSYPSTTGMMLAPNSKHLKWNTWGIEAKDIPPTEANKFNLLIIKSGGDPNDI